MNRNPKPPKAPIPVVWDGVEYPSYAEAARQTGIALSTLRDRIKRGFTNRGDCSGSGVPSPCTYNGHTYPSIAAAARAHGVSDYMMNRWIEMGHGTLEGEYWEGLRLNSREDLDAQDIRIIKRSARRGVAVNIIAELFAVGEQTIIDILTEE